MTKFQCRLLLILLLSYSGIKAEEEWGGRLGVSLQFGTHVQRIGVMYQLFAFNQYGQITQGAYAYYNFRSYGPRGSYLELKIQLGVSGHWVKHHVEKYQFNELSTMAPYRNSIGYSFNWYLDRKELSQTTGVLHCSVDDFSLAIDNDAFGLNQIDDKFRTGGFYMAYRTDSLQFGIQSTLWTGKSSDAPRIDDATYPSRFGYRDVSRARYGNQSHGILAARMDYVWQYNQNFRVEIGMDSERIRHAIQNKLIHDGISGRLVKSESPHYPMIQKNGQLFLFHSSDVLRASRPFFQLSANQPSFY